MAQRLVGFAFFWVALPISLFGSGCATATFGRAFYFSIHRDFKVGVTTEADMGSRLGPPVQVKNVSLLGETYSTYKYVYGKAFGEGAGSSALFVEFLRGQLNAYVGVSNVTEWTTNFDAGKSRQIAVETFGKDEVLSIMGRPPGVARCPSTLIEYRQRCQKGVEVWLWQAVPIEGSAYRAVAVTFDESGKVTSVDADDRGPEK